MILPTNGVYTSPLSLQKSFTESENTVPIRMSQPHSTAIFAPSRLSFSEYATTSRAVVFPISFIYVYNAFICEKGSDSSFIPQTMTGIFLQLSNTSAAFATVLSWCVSITINSGVFFIFFLRQEKIERFPAR